MHKTPSLLGAVRNGDIDGVRRLLTEGANPRLGDGRELPLHVAAQRGPLELVEVLIAGGALEWQPDAAGRRALEMAQIGNASDKAAIVALLDCDAIADASFRAAVAALHAGDVAEPGASDRRGATAVARANDGARGVPAPAASGLFPGS